MILGFTGTKKGLTHRQQVRLRELLERATEAHHGDCVGGDEEFHRICIAMKVPVVIHPPEDPKLRAYCKGAKEVLREKPYLVRNNDIINASRWVVGCPYEDDEPSPAPGQGTWSTIRRARKRAKLLEIIWPNS